MARRKQLPKGLRIRKNSKSESIQIAFTYKGVECREVLNMPPTPGNLRYAESFRHEILAEIERDTFNYGEKFPDSKRAIKFGFNTHKPSMQELFNQALEIKKAQVKASSYTAYSNAVKSRLEPDLGHYRVDHVTPAILRDWFRESGLSAKTIRNYRVILDFALNIAVQDDSISVNPLSTLKLEHILPKDKQSTEYVPDPLNKTEIGQMIRAADEWYRPMITTWILSGLRPGELIALTWEDINFEDKVINVDKAHVLGQIETPKTENSTRVVDMLPEVHTALVEQKKKTFSLGGKQGAVFRTKRSKRAFIDHRNLGRYVWKPTITSAKIRYRNQYQARHTYASQMLTEGNNVWWVAQQLGHKGIAMINKTYGRWIQNNDENRYKPKGDWSSVVK